MKHPSLRTRHGFTLVEIMIAVVIIGILVSMAWPAYARVTRRAKTTTFMNDVRIFANAADTYIFEQGVYPESSAPGSVPAGFSDYINTGVWTRATPLGGAWVFEQGGDVTSAFGVSGYSAPADQIQEIDSKFDDGDLSAGNMRQSGGKYLWVIAE